WTPAPACRIALFSRRPQTRLALRPVRASRKVATPLSPESPPPVNTSMCPAPSISPRSPCGVVLIPASCFTPWRDLNSAVPSSATVLRGGVNPLGSDRAAAPRPADPTAAAGLRLYHYLGADALLQRLHVGDDADQLALLLQAREGIQCGIQRLFIEGAEALIQKQRIDPHIAAAHL